MMRKTLENDFVRFDRDCAAMEKGLVAKKCDERALRASFRVVATVIARLIGKREMASLLREICADLDLVSAAPVARAVKGQGSAARLSAKMFRAASDVIISLCPSMPSTLSHWHGRARSCVPKIRIFHPK